MSRHTRYLLIYWPEVQDLMEVEGFEEHSKVCISDDPDKNPSYFVEEQWFENVASITLKVKNGELKKGTISLPNRYPDNIVLLEPINRKKHKYKLVTNTNYLRTSSQGDKIVAVDPEGGPYISIGSPVKKRIVTNIERNEKLKAYIITL